MTIVITLLVFVTLANGFSLVRERRARAARPPSLFVTDQTLRTHFVRAGDGPPVVFVHGSVGAHAVFTCGVLRAASARYDCVVVDRPGHGYTKRPRGRRQGHPSVQAEHLHDALTSLDVDRPVLVCHSWGAYVGLAFALEHPDEIAGIVLLGPAAFADAGPRPPVELRSVTLVPVFGAIVWRTVASVARPLFRAALDAVFWPEPAPPLFRHAALTFNFESPTRVRAATQDFSAPASEMSALSVRYPSISVPVAIVVGDDDWAAPPATQAGRLHACIASSTLTVVPGAGHMLPVTRPEVVLDAIADVWRRADAQQVRR